MHVIQRIFISFLDVSKVVGDFCDTPLWSSSYAQTNSFIDETCHRFAGEAYKLTIEKFDAKVIHNQIQKLGRRSAKTRHGTKFRIKSLQRELSSELPKNIVRVYLVNLDFDTFGHSFILIAWQAKLYLAHSFTGAGPDREFTFAQFWKKDFTRHEIPLDWFCDKFVQRKASPDEVALHLFHAHEYDLAPFFIDTIIGSEMEDLQFEFAQFPSIA